MSKRIFSFSVVFLAIWITLVGCSKREHTNPLDPNNPNSNVVLLPPPTGLKAIPDYGYVTLTWNAVPEAKSYQVYRGDKKIVTIDNTFLKDTRLTPGKRYSYQVASVHPCGLGGHKSKPVYATPKKGAKIVYSKYEVYSDDNGDSEVNRGEGVSMYIYLKNTGSDKAMGVSAQLSTNDSYITINSSYDDAYYSDLDPNEEYEGYYDPSYKFSVPTTCPYGHIVTFYLSISDKDGNSWADTFTVTVEKTEANVVYSRYTIYSDSNGDGNVDPGEDVSMYIYLKNTGSDKAMGVSAQLSTNDSYITINSSYDDAYYSDLDPNEEYEGYYDPSYKFSVSSSCPHSHTITFNLDIDDEDGNSWSDSFTVPVQ